MLVGICLTSVAVFPVSAMSETTLDNTLYAQLLDTVTRDFINNPDRNYLKGDTLYVSRIFKWFAEDFNHDIRGFFLQYASDDLRQALTAVGDGLNIRYLDYDWSLIGIHPGVSRTGWMGSRDSHCFHS